MHISSTALLTDRTPLRGDLWESPVERQCVAVQNVAAADFYTFRSPKSHRFCRVQAYETLGFPLFPQDILIRFCLNVLESRIRSFLV